jgi:hypothetical protein
LSAAYFVQGEFLVMPALLPRAWISSLADEARAAREALVRTRLPGFKSSGSVGWMTLQERAPLIASLYRSAGLRDLIGGIVDAPIVAAPSWDAHACALYHYDRAGDRVGFHYDKSFYRGVRYTVLIGLVNDSTSKLVCQLHRREPQRPRREVQVVTDPGTVVVFHGDKLWHSVTPLGADETRTVLTLQYVTDPRMGLLGRIVSALKDGMAYFGFREVLRAALAPRFTSGRGVSDGRVDPGELGNPV